MVDLIYTTPQREDVNILHEYSLDMAFGSDENNFALTLPLKESDIDTGCYIYIEDTEYGGIIDEKGVNTPKNRAIWKGRTWHGILAGHIIAPPDKADYLVLNGDANAVIKYLISMAGLSSLFYVPNTISGITIRNYIVRYQDLYTVLVDMLLENAGKLDIKYKKGSLTIQAQYAIDYASDDEWDSSQRSFVANMNDRPINHIVCLGSGNLRDRHVIHLFTDNQNFMPYLLRDNPTQDSDYILDQRNKVYRGVDERTVVYDYNNAETRENYVSVVNKPSDWDNNGFSRYYKRDGDNYDKLYSYVEDRFYLLTSQPGDWSNNCEAYYTRNGSAYNHVSRVTTFSYPKLSTQPSDWSTKYASYFTTNESGNYVSVQGVAKERWDTIVGKDLVSAEKDWNSNYSKYYTRYWDGVQYQYKQNSSVTKYTYVSQTKKPDDWDTNYNNYYQDKKGTTVQLVPGKEQIIRHEYVRDSKGNIVIDPKTKQPKIRDVVEYKDILVVPTWKKNKYYTRYSEQVAPAIDNDTIYYYKTQYTEAPVFSAQNVYGAQVTEVKAPTFSANTYYMVKPFTVKPEWHSNQYYELRYDHYADLVEKAIEKYKSILDANSIGMSILPNINYDIGDIVGATENITKLSVNQAVSKKIVSINETKVSVKYEVGTR